ncbi:MAG TPA: branched-chain amino acid ABC transporter substrate-binding protein [Chloroflexia bacterium]|jgi:branched-chain amino acid transport system substrate-binding protein
MLQSRLLRSYAAAILAAFLLCGCGPFGATQLPPATGQTLRIVSSLPYKGPSASQAALIRNGIDLAIDDKRSLLPGWRIEHIALDGGDDETGEWSAYDEAANARGAARDPSVVAYIGPYASGGAMVSLPILNQAGLLQALPVATWPGLTQPGWATGEPSRYYPTGKQTMVRLTPPDSAQARVAARKAKDMGASSALIVSDGSDYSNGMASAFKEEAEKLNVEVVGLLNVSASAEEWSSALAKTDVVFFAPSNLSSATSAASRIAEHPPSIGVFATDVLLSDRLFQQDRASMEGWYVTFNGDATPGGPGLFDDFAGRFEQRFSVRPSQYAANAYDVTAAILAAAARVGVDRGKILEEVLGGSYEEGVAGPLRFEANGDIRGGSLTLYRLLGGEYVRQEALAAP